MDPADPDPYQTMLTARVYEGLAMATSGADKARYTQQLYRIYPQLLPFSDLTMEFQLNAPNSLTETQEEIIDALKNTDIDFTANKSTPLVSLTFSDQGESIDVHYSVQSGEAMLQTGTLRVEPHELKDAGKLLAYRLFNIQKTKIGEQPPAAPAPEPEKEKNELKEEKKAVA